MNNLQGTLPEYPYIELYNDSLKVIIYQPDANNGYYRGSRFDWAGMIGPVTYKGHSFFSHWALPHNPLNPEHGIGPVEEFGVDSALGYDSTARGDTFIKIGVGKLIRPVDREKYFFGHRYTIQEPEQWDIAHTDTSISFTQNLSDEKGWGYSYVKTIMLDNNVITIKHDLRNTGLHKIKTDVYTHNFIAIDNEPINEHYQVTFGFMPPLTRAIIDRFASYASLHDNCITITKQVDGKPLFATFDGLTKSIAENYAKVENLLTGASITIEGSHAPDQYRFWACTSAICPEPFIAIDVNPGEAFSWDTKFTFESR